MATCFSRGVIGRASRALTLGLVLAAPASARAQDTAAEAPAVAQASGRPRLGLALGGGAARGLAHIGLLQWLEEHRVPVDVIAGTSMGGLVGGAYAAGLSPQELRQLMLDTDWDLVFLADSPFKYKTFRRKEDARDFPGQIDFGLKGGFTLPAGLNAGQQIELLLDRVGAPYSDLRSFDDLPTPFRCVATDLRGSGIVVLGSGSLPRAMRATMAIPGVFTPVELDGRLLVDGGTLNNVPADVVRKMGADVVIAVNVGASTDGVQTPKNLFSVLGQTLDAMMSSGVTAALKDADLLITPDLKGLTGMDWRKSEELADRGYQAAKAAGDQLLKYAVDEASYEAWRREREARRRAATPVIGFIRVTGVSASQEREITAGLEAAHKGRPFDRAAIERDVLLLTGTDRYEVIGYAFETTTEGTGLAVTIRPKSYGPPFLLPAIDLQNIDSNSFAMDLRARVVFYDTLVANSEIRADFALGSRQFAGVELYRRIAKTPLFVAPRAYYQRQSANAYDGDTLVAEYRDKTTGAGGDLGLDLGHRAEVRLGYDSADVRLRRRVGSPALPEAVGNNEYASLRFTFDGQTSPVIPTHGVYSQAALKYFFDTPNLEYSDGTRASGDRDFTQGEAYVSYFRTIHQRHRLFLSGAGGTSFGDDVGYYNQFKLGGLLRLGAFNRGAVVGSNYLFAAGGVLYNVFRLPDVLGGNGYLGGWLETGTAFEDWDAADVRWNFSGGVVLETLFGPFFLGGSVSLDSGNGRLYITLGPFR